MQRNATRQAAVRARPGSFRCCPVCSAAVRVPDDAKPASAISCPIRQVRTPGHKYACGFKTKPHWWRQRQETHDHRAAARTKAVRDAVAHCHAQIVAGAAGNAGFWERVRTEAMRRVPLEGDVEDAYKEVVPQPAAAAGAPAPAAGQV